MEQRELARYHPNKKTAGSTDGPFVNMHVSLGLMRSTLLWPYDTATLGLVFFGASRCENLIDQTQLKMRKAGERSSERC